MSDIVFLVKAGILSGAFYIQAAAFFATAGVMALWTRTGLPPLGISLFGIVSAACFFVPGLKYYRTATRAAARVTAVARVNCRSQRANCRVHR